ncbi:MAG TPA: cupin domain-containing protein [Candidatus Saccharimonadales bacterium]
MADAKYSPEIQTLVDAWRPYLASVRSWQELVQDIEPKATGCGPVYELDNLLDRPNESFAIADMRGVEFAQPHYHANGETEVYFVLGGLGWVVVGNEIRKVAVGDVVVTPSGTTHYAIPDKEQGLVLGVVNTPPFRLENNIDVTETNPDVGYDHSIFLELTQTSR